MNWRAMQQAVLVLGIPILGAAAGGIVAPRIGSSGMGWDQIADALGGVMVGGVFGLAIALLVIRRISEPGLARAARLVGLVVIGLLVVMTLRIRTIQRAAREAAAAEAARLPTNQIDPAVQSPP